MARTSKRGAGFGSVNNTQPAAAAGCGNGPISSAVIHRPIEKKNKKKKRCLSPIGAQEDLKISTFSFRLMVVKMLFPFFFFFSWLSLNMAERTRRQMMRFRVAAHALRLAIVAAFNYLLQPTGISTTGSQQANKQLAFFANKPPGGRC